MIKFPFSWTTSAVATQHLPTPKCSTTGAETDECTDGTTPSCATSGQPYGCEISSLSSVLKNSDGERITAQEARRPTASGKCSLSLGGDLKKRNISEVKHLVYWAYQEGMRN